MTKVNLISDRIVRNRQEERGQTVYMLFIFLVASVVVFITAGI